MSYCKKCGTKLADGARYCQKCGLAVNNTSCSDANKRDYEYEGKVYKCPNCGEVLKSFMRNCPACGFELRNVKATNAVKEFAMKLEAIEASRKYEGRFARYSQSGISKTDEQKINLIQNFSVPNTKEDMLEFMILATSNIDVKTYDSTNTSITKREKAIADAWNSKIKQVYEKAKRSYGDEEDFRAIQELYDKCSFEIKRENKKGILKWGLLFGWIPIFIIIAFIVAGIKAPSAEKKEVARLETIYEEAQNALENSEYKKALLNAEGLVYEPSVTNKNTEELSRQWNIKRELLIDEILTKAHANGVDLEYTPVQDEETTEKSSSSSGFVQGVKNAVAPGMDEINKNVDKFNDAISGEQNTTDKKE